MKNAAPRSSKAGGGFMKRIAFPWVVAVLLVSVNAWAGGGGMLRYSCTSEQLKVRFAFEGTLSQSHFSKGTTIEVVGSRGELSSYEVTLFSERERSTLFRMKAKPGQIDLGAMEALFTVGDDGVGSFRRGISLTVTSPGCGPKRADDVICTPND
jgi:hypothetical protein